MTGLEAQGLMRYWDHAPDAEWAKVLAEFPLFSGIGRRRLRKLVRHATLAEFAPGDEVVAPDAPAEALYVIVSGSARARGKRGARTLRTGDYFGELALLDGGPRSATIVAAGELQVMRLPRQSFLRLAQRESAVALTMLADLTSQFRGLDEYAPAPGHG